MFRANRIEAAEGSYDFQVPAVHEYFGFHFLTITAEGFPEILSFTPWRHI